MTPSVGRVVHYSSHGTPVREDGSQAYESQCRAAVVTEVNDDPARSVGLAVLNPTGMFFPSAIPYDESGSGGSWHWPERVE